MLSACVICWISPGEHGNASKAQAHVFTATDSSQTHVDASLVTEDRPLAIACRAVRSPEEPVCPRARLHGRQVFF